MELVDVIAKKNFHNTVVGEVTTKDRLRLPRELAKHFYKMGLVEIIENPKKAVPKIPALFKSLEDGAEALPASSPVDQALPEPTATQQRKGRRKKAGDYSA